MNIETKYHGTVSIDDQDIITFKKGIPGFLDEHQFALLSFDNGAPFAILQSINTPALAFVVTNPFDFYPDYEFELPDQAIDQLSIIDQKDVAVYGILTVHDNFEQSTINLQAPVVINHTKQLGKQVVLTNTSYQTKHALFQKTSAGQEG